MAVIPIFGVTYAEKIALTVSNYTQGQWLYQTDEGPSGHPQGYYQLRSGVWVNDNNVSTVTIQGIQVNIVTKQLLVTSEENAYVILDAGIGAAAGNQVAYIDFKLNSTLTGNIAVNEGTSGNPLELNSAVANDVSLVVGGGDVGVGTNSPVAKHHIHQGTVGNEVQRLDSVTTNSLPTDYYVQGKVETTDATVTTINTLTVGSGEAVLFEAHVRARRTGGAAGTANDCAGYVIRAIYKDVAGTPTLVGAINADFTAESQAAWDATFVVSGTSLLLRVTGAANNNITWHSTVRGMPLST